MTKVTHEDILEYKKRGSWRALEAIAQEIIEDIRNKTMSNFEPKLGGGTRLMLDLDHRISHDIDLFITDPQLIGYISPRLNDKLENIVSNYDEAADFIKLEFPDGEIDFIVRGSLLNLPDERSTETTFLLEPIAEVLAKKLFYRGPNLTSRDLFDWWSIEHTMPSAVPQVEMGKLLEKKYEDINSVLDIMEKSERQKSNWDKIISPDKPNMSDAIQWGKAKLRLYRTMASGHLKKSDNSFNRDDENDMSP